MPARTVRLLLSAGEDAGTIYFFDFADALMKSNLQPFIHTFTAESTSEEWSGRVVLLRETSTLEDRTSNLSDTNQPTLPPELLQIL